MDLLSQWLALYISVYYELFLHMCGFHPVMFVAQNVLVCLLVCLAHYYTLGIQHLSLDSWSLRYCLAVIGVAFTCLLFLVINLPVLSPMIFYDQSLWLWSPLSMMVSWVHSSLSPCCHHYSRSYCNIIIISECIIVLISFALSFHYCIIVVIIIV